MRHRSTARARAHTLFLGSSPRALVLVLVALGACARPRAAPSPGPSAGTGAQSPQPPAELWRAAKHTLEQRCVVCHGCYDAPCQLQLGSYEGIDRGASKQAVYEGSRLRAIEPTRLTIDAHSTPAWRDKGFFPVLPARVEDAAQSLIVRMLQLKRAHPQPATPTLSDADFDFDIERQQVCTEADDFPDYADEHPLWGMPYALPGLREAEHAALVGWIEAGAPHVVEPGPSPAQSAEIEVWEQFLNEPSLKTRLFARYIYEHLFLASLYFHELDERSFFRLVRSRTPPGQPVDEIPTRRPFDDPGVARVYYRLVPRVGRPLLKTHMPYALSPARLERYRELFVTPNYPVKQLPSYAAESAANPFKTFRDLPLRSRYRFMLDEAEFTMMGFIKGPVCRGQVALNVIQERFWISFVDPDVPWLEAEAQLLADADDHLNMPAAAGSNAGPFYWFELAADQREYLKKKSRFLERLVAQNKVKVDLSQVWTGDGVNNNAALTVLRHYDSATVVKGFVGAPPKTAWVVGYALLERIHYLLVAGFDVFGNVGHQLTTRLYMDFLRMEAEYNFLLLLPPARRRELVDFWYRDVSQDVKDEVYGQTASFRLPPNLDYTSDKPELELFQRLAAHTAPVRVRDHELSRIEDVRLRDELTRLSGVHGYPAGHFSEISFLAIEERDGSARHVSLIKDTALANVAQLFNEKERRRPEEDSLSVVDGFLGAYPDALFLVPREELSAFVSAVEQLDEDESYQALRQRFGVVRTAPEFWSHADELHEALERLDPLRAGLLDFNRLDAR